MEEQVQENQTEEIQKHDSHENHQRDFNRQNVNVETKKSHPSTYIEIVTEKDESGQPLSVLEVDLIISRERGEEKRNLSINFAGIDVEKKEMVEKSINIGKDNFYVLKKFFSQLEWDY